MIVIGLILLVVGILALLRALGVIDAMWDFAWPAILIILGLWFLAPWRRKRRWFWCGCNSEEKKSRRPSEDG